MKRFLLSLFILAGLIAAATFIFQRQIGQLLFEKAAESRISRPALASEDALTLGLCGTGSPLPNPDRAGPCNVIMAGGHMFVVDAGEGGARNLNLMGVDLARVDALLLTHFHSDHIDGMGPLALLHWTAANAARPLTAIGPEGVQQVVDGFNAAYSADHGYRIAHHGETIVPPSGGGYRAESFGLPSSPTVVFEADGLRITAFPVDHDPVRPAAGYRFDYKGRSVVLSGDTARSSGLEVAAQGADILVHDALQPNLVAPMTKALEDAGNPNTAAITRDILDYHASPEDAARTASGAGVRKLVLSHLVPPVPGSFFYPAFLGDAEDEFEGKITIGEDGMIFILPAGSTEIRTENRL